MLQLASFHPRFQFAGSEADDIANATNRAPHPTLHLLREDSVSRAVDAFPEAEAIYQRNIETLEALGASTDGRARRRGLGVHLHEQGGEVVQRPRRKVLAANCGRAGPSNCSRNCTSSRAKGA